MHRAIPVTALLLIGLFLSSSANAAAGTLVWHEAQAVIDLNGTAAVRERFYLQFANADDLKEFEVVTRQNGVELALWQRYNPAIFPHLGREDQILKGVITINPDPTNPAQRLLELSYRIAEPIATPVDTRTERLLRFEINTEKNKSILVPFKVGPLIQIPATTQLRIELPAGATVEETLPIPTQRPAENILVWQDTQSNQFRIVYSIHQQVKSINLTQQLRDFLSTDSGRVSLALLAIALILGYVFHKPLGHIIEDFLVAHTEPVAKDPESGKAGQEE